MALSFLFAIFAEAQDKEALIYRDSTINYAQLHSLCEQSEQRLATENVGTGDVVALQADYSPEGIALFLALARRNAIVLQMGSAHGRQLAELLDTGEAEVVITALPDTPLTFRRTGRQATHFLYERLRLDGHPGLVLFSSGTTGKSKGTVHDLSRLLKKYQRRRHDLRTLAFLRFDHIGGIDTLFYCLSNASCLVAVDKRDPAGVCATVARHRVQVLPVAPAFLSMLYYSKEYERHDLRSLAYVTYGAEVMPEATLRYCEEMFPRAKLVQKYGASEIGTPPSQSKSADSLWLKIGGEGYRWRVVDGILHIQAESAMLGYLNAPSPFTNDGWFITGDCVEVDGEYLRILGRDSDIINVGGRKVYPAEVEGVLHEVPEVIEAAVYGERNPLLGQIVAARVWVAPGADETAVRLRIKQHAVQRLEDYKAPVRILILTGDDYASERFKKDRFRQATDA